MEVDFWKEFHTESDKVNAIVEEKVDILISLYASTLTDRDILTLKGHAGASSGIEKKIAQGIIDQYLEKGFSPIRYVQPLVPYPRGRKLKNWIRSCISRIKFTLA